ncbi:hypothetical protein SASPL_135182 [Salvia splendens]|uniref:Uncharacterized protein n=1 Tax=Salvia splendens TaxID=180675 RepID=A0A8X8WY59_SALSN|nr:uncharacterized protein LOC121761745 [Salvia splendens]KAG6402967.1 hypothetical protein SASPL_135182 [Salvia splendens]
MAHNHSDVLENGARPWLLAHDHRHAKEQSPGFEAYGIKSQSFFEMKPTPVIQGQPRSGQKNHLNWAKSGPKMLAIFLGPKRKSCGTGVFIPRGQSTGTVPQVTNKPALSPVLLPSRVIQALNLNVHELGQEIKPRSEQSQKTKNIDEKLEKQKEDYISFSPEIILPEEWTY